MSANEYVLEHETNEHRSKKLKPMDIQVLIKDFIYQAYGMPFKQQFVLAELTVK